MLARIYGRKSGAFRERARPCGPGYRERSRVKGARPPLWKINLDRLEQVNNIGSSHEAE